MPFKDDFLSLSCTFFLFGPLCIVLADEEDLKILNEPAHSTYFIIKYRPLCDIKATLFIINQSSK